MNIGIFKSLGKIFGKPAPVAQMYVPRVAASARIAGVTGSELERTQQVQQLNKKLFELIDDVFEKKTAMGEKPKLNEKEFLNCVKQVIPDANIKIKYNKKLHSEGSVDYIYKNKKEKTVIGYLLEMKAAIEAGENEGTAVHEMWHSIEKMVQTKIAARQNAKSLIGRLKNFTEAKNQKHTDFYCDELYQRKELKDVSDEKQLKVISSSMKRHFEDLKTPSDEKIEILQRWRYSLKTELNAYKEECRYICKKMGNPDTTFNNLYGDYLFAPKIKIVEDMLKDEIASVRKLSAEKYGQKAGI